MRSMVNGWEVRTVGVPLVVVSSVPGTVLFSIRSKRRTYAMPLVLGILSVTSKVADLILPV